MIITSTINLSTGAGQTIANAYLQMVPHMDAVMATGVVPCDLFFYTSQAAQQAGASKIYPIDSKGNLITNITLTVSPSTLVKAGANCLMSDVFAWYNTAVAALLTTAYGWTITQ